MIIAYGFQESLKKLVDLSQTAIIAICDRSNNLLGGTFPCVTLCLDMERYSTSCDNLPNGKT